MFRHYTTVVLLLTAGLAVTIMAQRAVLIRNVRSGLVLEANQYEVKLQHYTGSPLQLWILLPADLGKHFIVNKATGNVLDIIGGKSSSIITFKIHGGANQQWYINSDKTIVSASNFAVDIPRWQYTAGGKVTAYPKHGKANQQFYFQYQ